MIARARTHRARGRIVSLAAAAVLASAGGGLASLAVASPVSAATPSHVAIVVGNATGCVSWHSGITGDEVLNDVAQVQYRNDGLIDQINGVPSPAHADATHYWSYWHDTGSGWVYSSSGASSYSPKAGTVEGWAYVNGQSSASPPPAVSYASICAGVSVPAPPATHHPHTSAPVKRTSSSTGGHGSGGHGSGGSPGGASGTGAAQPNGGGAAGTSHHHARTSGASGSSTARGDRSGTPKSTSAATFAATATRQPSLTPLAHNGKEHHSSSGSAVPLLATLGLVVVLGGGAGWTAWRRRSQE